MILVEIENNNFKHCDLHSQVNHAIFRTLSQTILIRIDNSGSGSLHNLSAIGFGKSECMNCDTFQKCFIQQCIFFQCIARAQFLQVLRFVYLIAVFVVWLYLICFFGNRVTETFAGISHSFYTCDWYNFPIELRMNFSLIIHVAQKPVYLRGFANMNCTLETFKMVFNILWFISIGSCVLLYFFPQIINGSYSFFMLLRRFNH